MTLGLMSFGMFESFYRDVNHTLGKMTHWVVLISKILFPFDTILRPRNFAYSSIGIIRVQLLTNRPKARDFKALFVI